MHATKQRGAAAGHEVNPMPDENARPALLSRGATRAVAAAGGCQPVPEQAPHERRALAEIGNLAGAMNSRCNVSKDGFLKCFPVSGSNRIPAAVKPAVQGDQPVSRKFETNAGNNKKVAPKPPPVPPAGAAQKAAKLEATAVTEEVTTWGTKQRRTSDFTKVRDGQVITSSAQVENASEAPMMSGSGSSCTGSSTPHPPEAPPHLRQTPPHSARRPPSFTSQMTCLNKVAYDAVMEETEEDLFNIDYADINNELAVTDYVEDIHNFYRRSEVKSCVPHDYMARQDDVNYKMRAILMDWLIEVHLKFELMPETLFLTINLIDRFLCQQQVPRRLLQLVGVTAMLVASKYEEIWAPEVDDFVYISDGAYTKQQLLAMERTILNTLQFNLTVPTQYVFMVRFLKAARADDKMEMVAWYMLELCLQEYNMLKFAPSMLAAAAVYSSNHVLHTLPRWTTSLHYHSGYCESQLKECASMMIGFHAKARDNSLGVVYKKYCASKFLSVAKLASAASLQYPNFAPSDCLSKS